MMVSEDTIYHLADSGSQRLPISPFDNEDESAECLFAAARTLLPRLWGDGTPQRIAPPQVERSDTDSELSVKWYPQRPHFG
jgi:hypothetical protein